MDGFEKIGYLCLGLVAICYLAAMFAGMVATFPFGIVAIVGVGVLLIKVVGGEIGEYTKMLAESREQALDRMAAEARRLGADAIVCMRFTTSPVMQGSAELLAYGTAVKTEPKLIAQPGGDQ